MNRYRLEYTFLSFIFDTWSILRAAQYRVLFVLQRNNNSPVKYSGQSLSINNELEEMAKSK